ncbi:MAG: phosphatase PAP2 family protein [Myxococcaceae bacterium]
MRWRFFWITVITLAGCYFCAALFGLPRGCLLPNTWVDHSVPFLKWSVWIYVLEYPMLPVAFFLVRTEPNFTRMASSLIISILISSLIFLVFPTLIERPVILNLDTTDALWQCLHWMDAPTNCFPSLHVSIAAVIAVYAHRESKIFGIVSFILAALIILSTLTTKQHYFVDVLGGLLVSWIAIRIAEKYNPS